MAAKAWYRSKWVQLGGAAVILAACGAVAPYINPTDQAGDTRIDRLVGRQIPLDNVHDLDCQKNIRSEHIRKATNKHLPLSPAEIASVNALTTAMIAAREAGRANEAASYQTTLMAAYSVAMLRIAADDQRRSAVADKYDFSNEAAVVETVFDVYVRDQLRNAAIYQEIAANCPKAG